MATLLQTGPATRVSFLDDTQFVATLSKLSSRAGTYFPAFLALMHPPGHSNYVLGRLHVFLAKLVQATITGEAGPRQAVSIPPQHGKSRLLAVRAVAWVIGAQPGINVALTGFSHSLLVSFVSEVRTLMATPTYHAIFPEVMAVQGRNRQDEAVFTNGSSVLVKSCGSKLTGRRVDWLIIDDAHAGREEAESRNGRNKILQWYFADCVSRLSPNAKVFIIGTRWHPEDLIGRLTDPEYIQSLQLSEQDHEVFEVTNFAAIADHDPDRGEECPLGREQGEALFPQERPLHFLESLRASIPAYEWDSCYMGRPRAAGSGQVDIARLQRNTIPLEDVPTDIPWIRGWDLALTEKQRSDYSVGALCAYDKATKNFYIINVWRKRQTWAKLKPNLIMVSLKDKQDYNCNILGMEAVSGFEIGLQEIRHSLVGKVKVEKRNPPRGGKLMRAQDWLNAIESGNVYMVRAVWNKDFLDEVHVFPDPSMHDDQCDGVSVAWECLVKKKKLLYA